jgi:hypothetical protein
MAKNGGDNNETRPGEQAHKSPMRDHLGHVADPVRDMLKKGSITDIRDYFRVRV